jgi:hypothetical protein
MAIKVTKAKQIGFSLPNKVGLMAEVAEALAAAKVNIEAVCAYEMEDEGYFMLVADDMARARKALSKMGVETVTDDVFYVEAPNKPGQLGKVSRKLSDAGINVQYVYASPGKGRTAVLVFKTDNDRKAMKALGG